MQDSMQWWPWFKVRKPSRQQIKRMVKNMRKVPIIKSKSSKYHNKDVSSADILLENELKNI